MTLLLFFLFFTKHFICDFPLQAFPCMYKNKGTYGHPGGLLHALIQGFGTWVIVGIAMLNGLHITPWMVFIISWLDTLIHYHIDWAKMNFGAKMGWGPLTSEWFWVLLGLDQYLHYLTYFLLVWMLV